MESAIPTNGSSPVRQAWWRRVPLALVIPVFVFSCVATPFMARWYYAASHGGEVILLGFIESPSTATMAAITAGAWIAPVVLAASYAVIFRRLRGWRRLLVSLPLLPVFAAMAIIILSYGIRPAL